MNQSHDAQEILICDVKVAKKAWMQRQRIDHAFEFQVQAIRVAKDKELCILDAVVFTTIAPTTDDHDDDDNLSHHLNDLVKGVIERDTRALAAPMTMAEIFRATTSSSINHQPVAVFGNVQLELKHLGRFILYDAYIYVKPQFVHVSESLPHTLAHQQPLPPLPQQQWEASRPKGEQEVEISAEDGSKHEKEISAEDASKHSLF